MTRTKKLKTVAGIINADVVYDTSTKSDEEIFGSDSIRNDPDVLTGSQVGVAMGLSHFTTPIALWKEKAGLEPIVIDNDSEVLKAGHAAEDFVANMFARKLREEYGSNLKSVEIINDTNMYRSRKYPWCIGQPDRFAMLTFKSGKQKLVGLECKTCYNIPAIKNWKALSFPCPTFYEPSGECQVNPTYDVQCRQYMMTTDLDAWYICCCWGFTIDDCAIALIRRDEVKEVIINEYALSFIDCCVNKVEPEIDPENAEAIAEYLNHKYDLANADKVEADASYLPLLDKAILLAEKKAVIKRLTKEAEALECEVSKELIEKTEGKGNYISFKNDEVIYEVKIGIPHFSDSIDVEKIKAENPEVYEQMAEIGRRKVTKTDLGKLVVNGEKFDATPYIIEGAVNTSKPLTISKATVKQLLK